MAAQSSVTPEMPIPSNPETVVSPQADGGSPQDMRTKILTVDPSTYVPKIEIRTVGGLLTEVRVTQREKTPELLAFDQLKMAILTTVTPEEARQKVNGIVRNLNPKIDNAEFLKKLKEMGANLRQWESAIEEALIAAEDATTGVSGTSVDPATLLMAVNKVEPGPFQRLCGVSFPPEKSPEDNI